MGIERIAPGSPVVGVPDLVQRDLQPRGERAVAGEVLLTRSARQRRRNRFPWEGPAVHRTDEAREARKPREAALIGLLPPSEEAAGLEQERGECLWVDVLGVEEGERAEPVVEQRDLDAGDYFRRRGKPAVRTPPEPARRPVLRKLDDRLLAERTGGAAWVPRIRGEFVTAVLG